MAAIDDMVVVELMSFHQRNMTLDKNSKGEYIDPDWKLLEAIETVLNYYMITSKYERWIQKVALDKLSLIGQLNGEYGEPQTPRNS